MQKIQLFEILIFLWFATLAVLAVWRVMLNCKYHQLVHTHFPTMTKADLKKRRQRMAQTWYQESEQGPKYRNKTAIFGLSMIIIVTLALGIVGTETWLVVIPDTTAMLSAIFVLLAIELASICWWQLQLQQQIRSQRDFFKQYRLTHSEENDLPWLLPESYRRQQHLFQIVVLWWGLIGAIGSLVVVIMLNVFY